MTPSLTCSRTCVALLLSVTADGFFLRHRGASLRPHGASVTTEAPPLSSADAGTIAARICSSSSRARGRREPSVARTRAKKRESILGLVCQDGHALQFAPCPIEELEAMVQP